MYFTIYQFGPKNLQFKWVQQIVEQIKNQILFSTEIELTQIQTNCTNWKYFKWMLFQRT